MYDVCIIGAGIIGCAAARELAKYKLKICLLEKNEDVSTETTKANSGIVHGGYAEKHGSIKSQFCFRGNQLYQQLDNELHFGFAPIGSLVIGFNEQDAAVIQELYQNGKKNGVTSLSIVSGEFVRQKEPNLPPTVTCALYCPTAGVTSPYEFAIALAENAITNGVELKLNTEVRAIHNLQSHFEITTNHDEKLTSKIVINAAGLYADEVAQMVGINEFTITPRQGQYLLLDKDQGTLVNSVVFQTPTPISKGILVTRTYHGNLLIGPDAENILAKDYLDTTSKNVSVIIDTARKTLPTFDLRKVITAFAGNRAVPSTGDFIIGESVVKGFINVAGIESPGLTAAPAIALRVVELVGQTNRIAMHLKPDFNPQRRPYHAVATMAENELNALIQQDPLYGKIVCRCETVSEGEIRDALRRPITINSIDAIKRRTRAGMGRCQSGFCTPRILEIICDELNLPREIITKKGGQSLLVMGRTKKAIKN